MAHIRALLQVREAGYLTPMAALRWRYLLHVEYCIINRYCMVFFPSGDATCLRKVEKPKNANWVWKGRWKLVDLGCAAKLGELVPDFRGTPGFPAIGAHNPSFGADGALDRESFLYVPWLVEW